MYKVQLEDAGIQSFIAFGTTATMLPISGDEVSLNIKEDDLEEALAIVKQLDHKLSRPVEEEYHDVDHGDIEFLKAVSEIDKKESSDKTYRSIITIMIIIILLLAIILGFGYF